MKTADAQARLGSSDQPGGRGLGDMSWWKIFLSAAVVVPSPSVELVAIGHFKSTAKGPAPWKGISPPRREGLEKTLKTLALTHL